jgi:hypothetical protein
MSKYAKMIKTLNVSLWNIHGNAFVFIFLFKKNAFFCNTHSDSLRLSLAAYSLYRHRVITNVRLTFSKEERRIVTIRVSKMLSNHINVEQQIIC